MNLILNRSFNNEWLRFYNFSNLMKIKVNLYILNYMKGITTYKKIC